MAPVNETVARKNRRLALICTGFIGVMVGVAFASVPAYRLFCQVTGYGGTPQIDTTAAAPGQGHSAAGDPVMQVLFNADTNRDLPWGFKPLQHAIKIPLGEQELAFFQATNDSDRPIIGTATFNVTPLKAAPYFVKIDCFCFTEQRLEPGQTMDMPVSFYVDPAIMEDENVREVRTITLSYTFFEDHDAAEKAGLPQPEAAPDHGRSQRNQGS